MAKDPYCKSCGKYHYDYTTFKGFYFCCDNCENDFKKKLVDPTYKTAHDIKQDRFMDKYNREIEEQKEERRRKLEEIENLHRSYQNDSTDYDDSESVIGDNSDWYRGKYSENRQSKNHNSNDTDLSSKINNIGKYFSSISDSLNGDKSAQNRKNDKPITEYWYVWLPILIGFAVWSHFDINKSDNRRQESARINLELEKTEDAIKIALQKQDTVGLISMVNKLVHPNHDVYEGKGDWFEGEHYDTYWDKKRQEYKDEIFSLGKKSKKGLSKSSKMKGKSNH
jgi:hypothetical protein